MRGFEKIHFVLLASLIARIPYLFGKFVVWDAAVYIGMGKAIFSLGQIGMWEASRPLVWPFFLGLIWKIGLDPILFGRILTLFFSLGCIYLTYLIGREIFNNKIGLIAALFLSFSPAFFLGNAGLLTEIPSTFFALLSMHLLIKGRFFFSGILIGIAFLTRFYQAIILVALLSLFFFYKKDINIYKKTIALFLGFFVSLIPFLIINQLIYHNPLYPFSVQLFLIRNTGWFWYEPWGFYFTNLIKENILTVFSIVGLFMVLRNKNYKKWSVLFIFLAFLTAFSAVAHKEMRFMILALPYLYLLVSPGLFYSFNKLKRLFSPLIAICLFLWLVQTAPQLAAKSPEFPVTKFQAYLNQDLDGNIWVSNPTYALYSDKKVSLIYYPTFDSERIPKLKEKMPGAGHILISTCDIPCPPNDIACPKEKELFIGFLKNRFIQNYYKSNSCEEYIFSTIPSP